MRRKLIALFALSACASPEPRPAALPMTTAEPAAPIASEAPAPSASASSSAAPSDIPAPIAEIQKLAKTSSRAYAIVRSLTDEVGPRLAGSPGDRAAVAWAQRTLAANGFANVHTEKVKVHRWERGAESASITIGGVVRPLAVTALGGSTATAPNGIEAEVVEVESIAALRALDKHAATGKIVFVNQHTRRTRTGQGYGEAVGARYRAAEIAKPLGALAVVVRSIGTDHDRLPHTGAEARDDKGIPAAALSNPDADLLHRALDEKKTTKLKLTLLTKRHPDAESANVVGEIAGREKPDEIVLLGAHLDSWDLGTGALDDGAGVGIVVDAARLIGTMANKPRRTLRVVLFANEENGREGGDEYARVHASELAKIVAAIEADLGADRVFAARYLGAPEARPTFAKMAGWLAPLGVEPDMSDAWGGSDIAPLRALGVPVVDLAQDASRYFDFHHTANDTFDKIDEAELVQAVSAVA